jgi:NADPH2:quinone reductase
MDKQNKCFKFYSFNEEDIKQETADLPKLEQEGELLINVVSCTLNQYDSLQLQGKKGKVDFPIIPGHEACGIVTEVYSESDTCYKGKLVAFWANGVFADYIKVNKKDIIVLPDNFSTTQGPVAYVNPITAYGLVDVVKSHNTKAFVSTAANSSIGIMINKLAKLENLTVINVVRSKQRVEEMLKEGVEYVLDMTEEDFKTKLIDLIKKLDAKVVIDPLAGDIVIDLIKCLPHGGTCINYGTQTGKPFSVDATDLRWGNKQIKSFLFSYWYNSVQDKQKVNDFIFANYDGIFKQNIQEELSMWDFPKGLKMYNEQVKPNARFIFLNK